MSKRHADCACGRISELRRLSPHPEKLEEDIADSRARQIHRRRLAEWPRVGITFSSVATATHRHLRLIRGLKPHGYRRSTATRLMTPYRVAICWK